MHLYTEFVLSEEQIRKGISKLEKEADKQEKIFRDAHQPEEAHRIATQVSELKEQLLEFQSKINLEGYIRYFYENTVTMPELLSDMAGRSLVFYIDEPARVKEQADAIELEFRESMEQRARKGYVLPGQMNILYSGEQVAATLEKNAVVTLYFKSLTDTSVGIKKSDFAINIAIDKENTEILCICQKSPAHFFVFRCFLRLFPRDCPLQAFSVFHFYINGTDLFLSIICL